MLKLTIESEIRPYLNSLIENGASFIWLQHFYQKNIKLNVAQAIDSLPVNTVYEQMRLVRIFIDNRAFSFPEKYQKLMPVRLLFRHSDNLAANLQNILSKEILFKFAHSPNSFLAHNVEEIIETLLSIQILLEMRERLEKTKDKCPANIKQEMQEQAAWLKKEIHSRVPITQRKINTQIASVLIQKWHFSKGYLGYDTGPGSLWYFCHGETKIALYLQREFLNLLSIALTFRDWVDNIAKQKFAIGKILLYSPMATFIFFMQLMNLAFSPYRLLRTILTELNQFIYYSIRGIYEQIFPKKHCHKPLLHAISLVVQIGLYTGLLLEFGPPYYAIPFAWANSVQAMLMISTLLVVYNGAMLAIGLGKYIFHDVALASKEPEETDEKKDVFKKEKKIKKAKIAKMPIQSFVYTPALEAKKQNRVKYFSEDEPLLVASQVKFKQTNR